MLIVACPNDGCSSTFKRVDQDKHFSECDYFMVTCPQCEEVHRYNQDHNCIKELRLKVKELEEKLDKALKLLEN